MLPFLPFIRRQSLYRLLLLAIWCSQTPIFAQSVEETAIKKEIIELQKKALKYSTNNLDSAILCIEKAIVMSEKADLKPLQIQGNAVMGEIYQANSNYKSAIQSYLKAVAIGEANDLEVRLGPAYSGLGHSYYYLKDIEKADKYIKKAADVKLKSGDLTHYSIYLGNLASIYHAQGKNEEALTILRSLEPTLLKNNAYESLAAIYTSIGSIQQLSFKNLDSAEYYYTKAIELAVEKNIRPAQVAPYHNLGDVKLLKGEFVVAIKYLETSLDVCKEAGTEAMLVAIYNTLSEAYDSIGNYEKAYQYKVEQQVLNDSVFAKDKQAAIQELEIKYQTAKQAAQLRKQNEAIQAQQLKYERTRLLLLTVLLLLLLASFVAFYFWQRKQANQRLEQEKSKIFQNIVHEIRTPLTLIKGPLFQLQKQYAIPDEEQNWKLVAENSDRLIQMVNELLDASKLEKGKYQLAYQFGEVSLFVQQIIRQFEAMAAEKEITLNCRLQDDIPPLRFATNALERILSNLLLNAIKYCPPKSLINIELTWSNDKLCLLVSDNGPGIAEKEQKRIFERFYQIEKQSHIGGTGIGLSMVKDLVVLMKGEIRLDSKIGKGTHIEIGIPIQAHKETAQEEAPLINEDGKPSLLIVEDDPQLLAFATEILQSEFTIIQASDGVQGVEKALEFLPHLILTDIMMPHKDGIGLLKELKENPLSAHIPILVFSAKNALESRLQGLKAGADAYLPKPFHPEELRLFVKNLWQTVQKNQQDYQATVQSELPFEQRVKGENEYINKIVDLVLAHIDEPNYSVNELADELFISRSQLHRKLDALTGLSTTQFIKMIRLEKAKDMLRAHKGNITEIAYQCGFSSPSYFTRSFKEYFGEAPSHFIEKSS